MLGIRVDVDQISSHTRPLTINQRRDVGDAYAGGGEGNNGESPDLAVGADVGLLELGLTAVGARVAAIEEAGAAGGAFVGHEVRGIVQDQIVD